MLVRFFGALVVAGFAAAAMTAASAQTPFRAVAVVNDSAITGYDLALRARLMVMLGFPSTDTDTLRASALEQLVDDRLKIQAGRQIGIHPTEEGYAAGLGSFAEQVGTTTEDFVARVIEAGASEQALRDMIDAELVWREVVRARFIARLDVGESEIDAEIALLAEASGTAYHLREIGLPLNGDGRTADETRALAQRLADELAAGGDFAAAARRHSRAPSAERGGDVGWVGSSQMPAELYQLVRQLGPGGVSPPVSVQGGVTILKVEEVRADAGASFDASDPALRDEIRNRIANQRAARLAEGYLQELRRDALIELR